MVKADAYVYTNATPSNLHKFPEQGRIYSLGKQKGNKVSNKALKMLKTLFRERFGLTLNPLFNLSHQKSKKADSFGFPPLFFLRRESGLSQIH